MQPRLFTTTLEKELIMEVKRKIILPLAGVIALIGMSTAAMAFDGNRDRGMEDSKRGNHIERMREKLNLTDEQADKIQAIFKAKRQQKKEHRKAHKEMRIAMMNLDPASPEYDGQVEQLAQQQADVLVLEIRERAQMRKEIHAILTPEQREKSQQMLRKRMERSKDRRHGDSDRRDDRSPREPRN